MPAPSSGERSARYAVPALERGFDVIELLAEQDQGLSLSDLGRALSLSPAAIFRCIASLERRGYITRDPVTDTYTLSLRLFELSHRQSPTRRLLDIAVPAMRALAQHCGQDCHLSVHDNGTLLVIADVEGPGPLNLSFRLGSRWPMQRTVSGRVLLANQTPELRKAWLGLLPKDDVLDDASETFAEIAARGHDRRDGETLFGLVDIGVPVFGTHGAVAALTVSMMVGNDSARIEQAVLATLLRTADDITTRLGGKRLDTRGDNRGRNKRQPAGR